jgi:hypothetical protein
MTLRHQAAAFVVGLVMVFLAGAALVGLLRDRRHRGRPHA